MVLFLFDNHIHNVSNVQLWVISMSTSEQLAIIVRILYFFGTILDWADNLTNSDTSVKPINNTDTL